MTRLSFVLCHLSFLTVLFVATLSLPGCGYTVGPSYSGEIRTVHVPTFTNSTYRRGLEFQLTEAVQKQIQMRTSFRLAKAGEADTRLTGRIVSDFKTVIGETGGDDARSLQVNLLVELTWEDLRTQKILMEQKVPVTADKVQQQTTSEFAVETGQSLATAQQDAIDRMARQIVELMQDPW